MIKHKFKAYNRMYDNNGKLIGRKYVTMTGNSKKDLEKKTKHYNNVWNKKNKNYTAVFVGIKERTHRKPTERRESNSLSGFGLFNTKPSRSRSPFGINFRF